MKKLSKINMKTIKQLSVAVCVGLSLLSWADVTTKVLKGTYDFMMPPKTAWATIAPSSSSVVSVTEEMGTSGNMGYRVIHLRASDHATKQSAVDLAASGLVQTGDIYLSFRPEWSGTLAYAHMQLGISHTGLAFVVSQNGQKFIHTLESPISYSSAMNYTEHYGDLNAIHVIRPTLSDAEKANLNTWAQLALQNQGQLGFYTDYGKPFYKRGIGNVTTPRGQIQYLAKLLKSGNGSFQSYCSEWAWTFLGLRKCSPANYSDNNPDCSTPIFGTEQTGLHGGLTGIVPQIKGDAGLIQGPEASLISSGINQATRTATLTGQVFVDVLSSPDDLAGRMSSGHRAVAQANSGLMKTINKQYYGSGETAQVAAAINAQVVENFSPTSFMIRSNAGLDGFQYVGTIVWDK